MPESGTRAKPAAAKQSRARKTESAENGDTVAGVKSPPTNCFFRGGNSEALVGPVLRGNRRLDPAPHQPPPPPGALSRRLEQGMFFPETRRPQRASVRYAPRRAGLRRARDLFRGGPAARAGRAGAMGRDRIASVGFARALSQLIFDFDLGARRAVAAHHAGRKPPPDPAAKARSHGISENDRRQRPARRRADRAHSLVAAGEPLRAPLRRCSCRRFPSATSRRYRKQNAKAVYSSITCAIRKAPQHPLYPRSRENAPVSTPIAWEELSNTCGLIISTSKRCPVLRHPRVDPWRDFDAKRREYNRR